MHDEPHQRSGIPKHHSLIAELRAKLDALEAESATTLIEANLRQINDKLDTLLHADGTKIDPATQAIRLQRVVDDLPVGIMVTSRASETLVCNQVALDLLSLTSDQLIGKTAFDLSWNIVHKDGSPFPAETHPVSQAIAAKRPIRNVVMGVYRPEYNDRVWLLVNAEPEFNSNGEVEFVIATFRDVTKTHQLEAELRVVNERYQLATGANNIGIWEWDLVSNEIYLAQNFKLLFGYSADDELHDVEFWRETIHPDDRRMVNEHLQQFIDGEIETYKVEVRIIRKDGEIRWMLVRATLEHDEDGRPHRMIGSHTDISGRKEAELALLERENRLRTLFQESQRQALELKLLDTVRSAVAQELDLNKVIQIIVESIAQTFGYTLVSLYLLRDNILHLQHQVGYDNVIAKIPVDRGISGEVVRSAKPRLIKDVRQTPHFLGAIDGIVSEITVPLLDGERVVGTLNVESIGELVLTEADLHLVTALTAHTNVAIQRARLYTELRDKEIRARALLNAIPEMVVRMRRDGQFLEMKPASYFRPAFSPEVFMTKTIYDIFPSEVAKLGIQAAILTLDTGSMQTFEYELEAKKGKRTFEALIVPYQTDEVLSIIREITLRKQATQRELELTVERERVEILTEFIQNASHDFRTPLAVIINNLYLLRHVGDPAQHDHYISVIDRQVTHLSKLLENMLTITRLDSEIPLQTEATQINTLVGELAGQFEGLVAKKEIDLVLETASDLPVIQTDIPGINRVLSNLVYNAIRYTPSTGTIRLRTRTAGNQLVIEVCDTGSGINPEHLPRVFDRFYRAERHRPSNLETGGAGLGLAIAKKIVEAHGGTIEVESTVGEGTCFRIFLPIR